MKKKYLVTMKEYTALYITLELIQKVQEKLDESSTSQKRKSLSSAMNSWIQIAGKQLPNDFNKKKCFFFFPLKHALLFFCCCCFVVEDIMNYEAPKKKKQSEIKQRMRENQKKRDEEEEPLPEGQYIQ
jgi:hypothetical protein